MVGGVAMKLPNYGSTRPFMGHQSKCENCGAIFSRTGRDYNCGKCVVSDTAPVNTSSLPEITDSGFGSEMEAGNWRAYRRIQWVRKHGRNSA